MASVTQQLGTAAAWGDASGVARPSSAPSIGADDCHIPKDRLAQIARSIESEMVPRIMLERGDRLSGRSAPGNAPQMRLAPAEIRDFAALVLVADRNDMFRYIDRLRQRGMPLEDVYLQLFAPTARLLGDDWVSDRLTFTEVTLGLWQLHHLLRHLSDEFHSEGSRVPAGFQVLLLPAPGEQHTFGLFMVAEFFRQSGWGVSSGPFASQGELARMARGGWFSIVGFSVSREDQLDAVAAEIRNVRRASRNQSIGVMVGGRVFVEHPELVKRVGADATAIDGREAVHQAQNLVALKDNY